MDSESIAAVAVLVNLWTSRSGVFFGAPQLRRTQPFWLLTVEVARTQSAKWFFCFDDWKWILRRTDGWSATAFLPERPKTALTPMNLLVEGGRNPERSVKVSGSGTSLFCRGMPVYSPIRITGFENRLRSRGRVSVDMKSSRRTFLQTISATGLAAAFANARGTTGLQGPKANPRRFHSVQIDVFTPQRLQGNPLCVFTDARGLSDSEMQDLARETNLQETTFVFPRDPVTEREHGVKVRIFVPYEELPFAGHPTLGTAMVLRNRQLARSKPGVPQRENAAEVILDLTVGKVPVYFREDTSGSIFGEMHQVEPVFGPLHDRDTVAALLDLKASDIAADWPIQTISTGLPFAIVPIKQLSTLQSLRPDLRKVYEYLDRQEPKCEFYYVTRDRPDREVGLRARAIFPNGEDPATGSAAGCTAAWMVRYGMAQPEQTVHIEQGVEIKRPSQIFVRASRTGDKITNVRVGGHAVEIMESEVFL